MKLKSLILFAMVLAIPATAQVKIQANMARYVNPTDGQQLYDAFCASCHGGDLTGNTALKQTVVHNLDLTQASRRHPRDVELRVRYQIEHGSVIQEHPVPMPEWRKILYKVYNSDNMMTSAATKKSDVVHSFPAEITA